MVDRFDIAIKYPCGRDPYAVMVSVPDGSYVMAAHYDAARAEIERLKDQVEMHRKLFAESALLAVEWARKAEKAEAERDEARAQVAAAYEAAAYEADFYSYLAGDKIRALKGEVNE